MNKKILSLALALSFLFTIASCTNNNNNDDDDILPQTKDTEYSESKIMNDDDELVEMVVNVKDYGLGTGNVTWEKTKTYVLDGLVFVNEGQTLTIEAGTIIKAKSGQGENASALIVARGGKIMAEGTATAPIVMTSAADNIHYDHTSQAIEGGDNLPVDVSGLWGGLIVLGKATNNNTTEKRIEGIPAGEDRALYGGSNDADNSGVIKYVSIRHGGTDIGTGNEINGFTLGSVGNGAEIEYIEVISNQDDGIEWFGGAANMKHVIVAYCGDDSYDYDEGYHGKNQFMVAMQKDGVGDRLGEHDGGPSDNEVGEPYAEPYFYNATYIGRNNDKECIIFRDNAGGHYVNSIMANQVKGFRVEYRDDKHSSYDMLKTTGLLTMENNVFSNVNSDVSKLIFAKAEKGTLPSDAATVCEDHFNNNNNAIEDLNLTDANPVPAAMTATGTASTDTWFDNVNYVGAFNPGGNNWAAGWTRLSAEHAW
jgi:hypothetical protein